MHKNIAQIRVHKRRFIIKSDSLAPRTAATYSKRRIVTRFTAATRDFSIAKQHCTELSKYSTVAYEYEP